jgi:hypothetical protein
VTAFRHHASATRLDVLIASTSWAVRYRISPYTLDASDSRTSSTIAASSSPAAVPSIAISWVPAARSNVAVRYAAYRPGSELDSALLGVTVAANAVPTSTFTGCPFTFTASAWGPPALVRGAARKLSMYRPAWATVSDCRIRPVPARKAACAPCGALICTYVGWVVGLVVGWVVGWVLGTGSGRVYALPFPVTPAVPSNVQPAPAGWVVAFPVPTAGASKLLFVGWVVAACRPVANCSASHASNPTDCSRVISAVVGPNVAWCRNRAASWAVGAHPAGPAAAAGG